MKNLTILLIGLLLLGCTKYQLITIPSIVSTPKGIELTADTTITGVWDGNGKVITIHNYKIHGTGTFQNWDVDASVNQAIFDTSLNIQNIKCSNSPFSTMWLGANSANADNYWILQKSINICMANHLQCFTPGGGTYKHSKSLNASIMVNGSYQQTYLDFEGDASYWDNGKGTTFLCTDPTAHYGINFQQNKGSILRRCVFNGLWKSPNDVSDSAYFSRTEAAFTDQSGYDLSDWYAGIAIDYNYDGHSRSGSTGMTIEDVSVGGFAEGISFSENGYTQNDEAHVITNLHLFDLKFGIVNHQAQEKGTVISNIYSWGNIYNIVNMGWKGTAGAGFYTFNGANIAGRCIQPINISVAHWFPSTFSNWFCENIGNVGNFSSASTSVLVSNCEFDLAFSFNKHRSVVISNANQVEFNNCMIQYYDGLVNNIYWHGYATFDANCKFGLPGSKLVNQ